MAKGLHSHALEFGEVRAHHWVARRASGQLADQATGGSTDAKLLAEEEREILAAVEERRE